MSAVSGKIGRIATVPQYSANIGGCVIVCVNATAVIIAQLGFVEDWSGIKKTRTLYRRH